MIRRAWAAFRHRLAPAPAPAPPNLAEHPYSLTGRCTICGEDSTFLCADKVLYRESLVCQVCLSTSRYRSMARGVLQAIRELTGVDAASLAELEGRKSPVRLRVYDTQVPFRVTTCAYPIPDRLGALPWIDLEISIYKTGRTPGTRVDPRTSIQNLEALTFPGASFDIVLTSDVMEHVRLHDRAHREIARVLKPGGVYLFTVPHYRHQRETFYRVQIVDPEDPSTDVYLCEKEYHGDQNAEDGMALSYRSYGTDIDDALDALGFDVEYTKRDMPEYGIMNTELFYCRKRRT
jgi:SAM-dependent methyltransferase